MQAHLFDSTFVCVARNDATSTASPFNDRSHTFAWDGNNENHGLLLFANISKLYPEDKRVCKLNETSFLPTLPPIQNASTRSNCNDGWTSPNTCEECEQASAFYGIEHFFTMCDHDTPTITSTCGIPEGFDHGTVVFDDYPKSMLLCIR